MRRVVLSKKLIEILLSVNEHFSNICISKKNTGKGKESKKVTVNERLLTISILIFFRNP